MRSNIGRSVLMAIALMVLSYQSLDSRFLAINVIKAHPHYGRQALPLGLSLFCFWKILEIETGVVGFEPTTSWVKAMRSALLNYTPSRNWHSRIRTYGPSVNSRLLCQTELCAIGTIWDIKKSDMVVWHGIFLEGVSDCHGLGKRCWKKPDMTFTHGNHQNATTRFALVLPGDIPLWHPVLDHVALVVASAAWDYSELCHHCWDSSPADSLVYCGFRKAVILGSRWGLAGLSCCYLSKTLDKHLENLPLPLAWKDDWIQPIAVRLRTVTMRIANRSWFGMKGGMSWFPKKASPRIVTSVMYSSGLLTSSWVLCQLEIYPYE